MQFHDLVLNALQAPQGVWLLICVLMIKAQHSRVALTLLALVLVLMTISTIMLKV